MQRKCKKCGQIKNSDDFYESNPSACKECVREAVKSNRKAKEEYYKAFDRMRAKLLHRVEARKEYAKTGTGKLVHTECCRRYRKNHPEAYAAHKAVAIAVSSGRIVKPGKCEDCGCKERLYAHHEDYSKPLDVNWVCSACHRKRHIEKAA